MGYHFMRWCKIRARWKPQMTWPSRNGRRQRCFFFQGQSLIGSSGRGVKTRYPAFDVTPAALISHLVGFDGLYTPETFRQKYQIESKPSGSCTKQSRKYLLIYGIPGESQYSYLISALKAAQSESLLVPEMRPELWARKWWYRDCSSAKHRPL